MTLGMQDLSVGFQTRSGLVPAVRRISLTIKPVERVALVGESGCGKTVLALALLGLLPRNAQVDGSASLGSSNLLEPKVAAALRGREIAMCWSNAERYFNPVVPIGVQIDEAYALHHRRGALATRERTLALLGEVGFEDPERICQYYPFQLRACQEINRTSRLRFVLYWCWCPIAISSIVSVPCHPFWTSECGVWSRPRRARQSGMAVFLR